MAILVATLTGCSTVTEPTPDASGVTPANAAASAGESAAGVGGRQADPASKLPGLPTAEKARTALAGLKVAAQGSLAGYSRASLIGHPSVTVVTPEKWSFSATALMCSETTSAGLSLASG